MRTSVKTIVAGVAMTLSLAGLAACGGSDDAKADSPKTSATPAADKADLKGIPDVVATVDGQDITKKDFIAAYENQFAQAQQTAATSGTPVDQDALKKQTADSMVSNKLLVAEADKRKFKASDADIDKAITDYATQAGAADAAAYLKTLADQGLDEAQVRSEIGSQLKLDQLLAEEAGDKEPTESELKAIYDAAVAQQDPATAEDPTQAIPPYEEVKDQVKEQAVSQKQSAAAEKLLTELKKTAKITVNL